MAAAVITDINTATQGDLKYVWGRCNPAGTTFHLPGTATGLSKVTHADFHNAEDATGFNVIVKFNTAEGTQGDSYGDVTVESASASVDYWFFIVGNG